MEKYYHSYDLTYEKFTPDWFSKSNQDNVDKFLFENSESMILFLESYFAQFSIGQNDFVDKEILITGCGFGGLCHFFAKKQANVTGIDVSSLAIVGAKEIANNKNLKIDYLVQDLCNAELTKKYDFIIDDHLLHCIANNHDRLNYLSFIRNSLKSNGLFLLETMAFHNRIQTPVGYFFDEDNILWQQINGKETMIRKILPSIDLENELIHSDLKINYLYYHAELAFQVFTDNEDYPFDYLPRTIRMAAKLNNA